ncbi:MAG: dUTP diphosphatase [Candidatus Berkelbacteria bacterium]|nr:MAG: dUTP diphosphatase [Candidatus Berkelbacteria bacterium]QQG51503.1 MAG: dUTP diphosphatase [Candidatus Berkelbacteria bacterium]
MEVEICRIDPEAHLPEYKTAGAACFDLETIEEKTLAPGEIANLRTGLVMRVPSGYVLILQPRSSSPRHGYHMPHGVGIVDSDYSGPDDELFLQVRNFTDTPISIEKHQRMAQGYIAPLPKIEWKEISRDALGQKSRGGFGSTGKK